MENDKLREFLSHLDRLLKQYTSRYDLSRYPIVAAVEIVRRFVKEAENMTYGNSAWGHEEDDPS